VASFTFNFGICFPSGWAPYGARVYPIHGDATRSCKIIHSRNCDNGSE
jgi:hypothetical protein